jgi:NAD(P)-dependent dehydrogenase (short-subunit alcohol dehydrogenase family)
MGTAMVWGASGGIGRALVARLVEDGWTVVALSRHPADLADLTPHAFEVDLADPAAIERAVARAGEAVEAVDLWIYAAGDITSERVADMSPQTWRRILDANLSGAFLAAHYSLPLLAGDAHLVFLGAVSERMRLPGLAAYAAAKAGLEALAETLRKEERRRRVTVVRPGAVETAIWQKVPFKMPHRALKPEDVAGRIVAAYDEGHSGILDL